MEEIRRILNLLIENPYEENLLLEMYAFYERENLSKCAIIEKSGIGPIYQMSGYTSEMYVSMVDEPQGISVHYKKVDYLVIHCPVSKNQSLVFFRRPDGVLCNQAYVGKEQINYISPLAMDFCLRLRLHDERMRRVI